jgi:hypothetical protein
MALERLTAIPKIRRNIYSFSLPPNPAAEPTAGFKGHEGLRNVEKVKGFAVAFYQLS